MLFKSIDGCLWIFDCKDDIFSVSLFQSSYTLMGKIYVFGGFEIHEKAEIAGTFNHFDYMNHLFDVSVEMLLSTLEEQILEQIQHMYEPGGKYFKLAENNINSLIMNKEDV